MAYQTVWSGSLADFLANAQAINQQNFVTGDFGQIVMDLSQAANQLGFGGVSSIPQFFIDEVNATLSVVSGYIGTVANGMQMTIQFQSTSPTLAVIAQFLLALAVLVAVANIVPLSVQKQVASTTGQSIFCVVGGALGVDCQTGQILTVAVGALLLLKALR